MADQDHLMFLLEWLEYHFRLMTMQRIHLMLDSVKDHLEYLVQVMIQLQYLDKYRIVNNKATIQSDNN